jgi:small-conductance mechanosensitive channel
MKEIKEEKEYNANLRKTIEENEKEIEKLKIKNLNIKNLKPKLLVAKTLADR